MVSVIALSGCASVPSTSLTASGGTVGLGRTAKLDSRWKVFGLLFTEMKAAIPATAARPTTARIRKIGGGTRLRGARASLGRNARCAEAVSSFPNAAPAAAGFSGFPRR